ncbi:hypothetical protein NCC49_000143 [Naganishia albida]|nr:hypothetical protein NCC49_000143 [Naganishia albida]
MTFTLQLDDPSLLILLAIIALALLSRSGLFTAQPLTHPLVFARQGEPSATRVKGKSPVYKHWSGTNGAGLRPENGVVGLKEVLKAREGTLPVDGIEVDLWKTSGRLYTGLRRLVPDTTSDASNPIAAFLPSKTTKETFLPTLLLNLLPAHDQSEMRYHLVQLTDKSHLAHAFRDEDGVQLLYTTVPDIQTVLDATTTSNGHIIVPSANEITPELEKRVSARGWRLVTLEDVMSSDPLAEKIGSGKASEPAAVHSVHYINGPEGVPQRGTVTNQTITASLVSLLALFPVSAKPTNKHTIVTSVDLAQPVGLAIATLAIYKGKGIRWIDEVETIDREVASARDEEYVAFLSTPQLTTLTARIVQSAAAHASYPLVRRRKEAALLEGSISRKGCLENLVFGRKRGWAERLTSVVLVDTGEPATLPPDALRDAFIHLSIPIIRTFTAPTSASPVCATLYHDLQLVPFVENGKAKMHVGPPAAGAEVELRGDGVEVLNDGGDPRGTMYVRAPAVLTGLSKSTDDGWVSSGRTAVVRSNGTFVMV